MDDNWGPNPEAGAPSPTLGAIESGSPAAKRPLPPWAWGLIGLLAGAVLVGGAWALYQGGFAFGRRSLTASAEDTSTQVAQVVTGTIQPAEPIVAGPTDADSNEPVVITEPDPGAADPPPASDPPPATPATATAPAKTFTVPKITKLYAIPTTWKVIFKHSNTGPWELPNPPGAPLDAGYLRMTVLATDNANNSGYVQLKRVDGGASLPNYGILYNWSAGVGNVVYKVTDPILIESAGTYQLRVSIHGPWTIILER
jgi:hypothetical protein